MHRPRLEDRMVGIAKRCMARHGARAAILVTDNMKVAFASRRVAEARKWRLVREKIWELQGLES